MTSWAQGRSMCGGPVAQEAPLDLSIVRIGLADLEVLNEPPMKAELESFGIEISGMVSSMRHVEVGLRTWRPDVLVTDCTVGGRPCFQMISLLLQRQPGTKIVVFGHHDSNAVVKQAYRAGALSFVPRRSEPSVLAMAIHLASRGVHYVPEELGMAFNDSGDLATVHGDLESCGARTA